MESRVRPRHQERDGLISMEREYFVVIPFSHLHSFRIHSLKTFDKYDAFLADDITH